MIDTRRLHELINKSLAHNYVIYEDEEGKRVAYKKRDEFLVKPVQYEQIARDIVPILNEHFMVRENIKSTIERARTWIKTTQECLVLGSVPRAVTFKDEQEYSFNKLDIVPSSTASTPCYDSLIRSVVVNKGSMEAFLYSLFVQNSYKQQYLWMQGMGGDGKGTLCRLIQKMVGSGSCALHVNHSRIEATCVGKRVGIFSDINNSRYPMSSKFKSLTGGDSQLIDQKYKEAYTALLETKFIFTSNQMPEISSSNADKRRVIYVEFEPTEYDFDPDFENKLYNERAGILAKWKRSYETHTTNEGPISVDKETLSELSQGVEANLSSIIKDLFSLATKDGSGQQWVSSKEVVALINEHPKAGRTKGGYTPANIKACMNSVFPETKFGRRENYATGEKQRCFTNLRLKGKRGNQQYL